MTTSERSARASWRATATVPRIESEWQLSGRGQKYGSARFRRGQLVLAWLGFGGLVGLLIWVSLWLHPASGTCLVLVGAGYEDNLAIPQNHHGMEGLRLLASLGGQGQSLAWLKPGGLRALQKPTHLVKVENWDRGLKSVNEKTILIYLALHGAADRQGAYLLPQKALQPLEPGKPDIDLTRLRLETILDRVAQLPRWQQIVLMLDATQIDADWHLGVIHNGFANELERLNDRIAALPNLVVISASGPGQRSWPVPEFGRTVFTHFVLNGLEGSADLNRDNRIGADELYKYVSTNVERWVALNRDARQVPVLLPKGKLGLERAHEMKLAISLNRYHRRDTATAFQPPPELVAAWKDHDRLFKLTPHPTTYAPGLWRQYNAMLLRAEQLLVAGEGEVSRDLLNKLRDLSVDIQRSGPVTLESLASTLAMPAAAGITPVTDSALTRAMDQLWETEPKDRAKRWQEIQTSFVPASDVRALQLLRIRATELILQRAAQDPASSIARAAEMLHLTEDPTTTRSAEAQFLIMLQRDLPAPKSNETADLTQLALRVRLHAERAALGLTSVPESVGGRPPSGRSEQVLPWIQHRIEEADQLRRTGQDLLFSTARSDRDRARTLLEKADKVYGQAEDEASKAQGALAMRDLALARLPWIAQWAARRYVGDPARQQETTDIRKQVEDLLHKAHALAILLQVSSQKDQVPNQKSSLVLGPSDLIFPAQAVALSEALRQGLTQIETILVQMRTRLGQSDSPDAFRDADDALSVPFGEMGGRMELLTRRSRISRQLLVRTSQNEKETLPPVSEEMEIVRSRAAAQGRLALAALGPTWFNDPICQGRETFAQVQQRLENFRLEEQWWRSLVLAGDEIGKRWQRLPVALDTLTTPERQPTYAQRAQATRQADRLLRFIDAAGNLQVNRNAAETYRKLQLQQLLLWQGQRTWLDHWFSEDPTREPYFRAAGQVFLEDARRIDPSAPGVAALQELLTRSGWLQLRLTQAPGFLSPSAEVSSPKAKGPNSPADLVLGPSNLVLPAQPVLQMTTEHNFPVTLAIQSANSKTPPPPGLPLLWVELGAGLEAVNPADLQPQARGQDETKEPTMTAGLRSPALELATGKPPLVPKTTDTTLTTRALFRGQRLELQTKIQLHPLAEMIRVQYPLPIVADLAVRTPQTVQQISGVASGNLVIVLDCSGSMGPPQGQAFSATTKFAEATGIVRAVLQKVPRGTTVSVWAFGQALGAARTAQRPEETIQRVVGPVTWTGEESQVSSTMSQIEYPALNPWNESPIVRAMIRAARDDLSGTRGLKTLLLLTDGMDNRIANDTEFNPDKKDAATLIRENFRDIQVRVLAFKVPAREEATVRQQFKVVEELPIPGQFTVMTTTADLSLTLQQSIRREFRQRLPYFVDAEDNRPITSGATAGVDISTTGGNDRWLPGGLIPGGYKVRTDATRRVQRSILLNPADALLLELGPRRGADDPAAGLEFRRVLYARSDYPYKPRESRNGWEMALLQNQLVTNRGAQMMLTLERERDLQEPTIQQVKAAATWFEVATAGEDTVPFSQKCYYLCGYPAPAWGIDIPQWPARNIGPFRPRVQAWWSPYREPEGARLERGHQFSSPFDISNIPISLTRGKGLVESVVIEERLVETHPAQRDRETRREKKPCLVVRLTCPPGDLGWVRLHGLELGGQEHYFFTSASKVTAVFWPVTRATAERLLRTIEIVSVDAFKKRAEENAYSAKLDTLGEPQPGDLRPFAPVDLWKLEGDGLLQRPGEADAPSTPPARTPPPVPVPPPAIDPFVPPSPQPVPQQETQLGPVLP